jgi:hypothetical protein
MPQNPTTRALRSPLRMAWSNMRCRCYNVSAPWYGNYGGRGIVVCTRWNESFQAFADDMGPHPGKGYSLDRIDNEGNYEPGNCRWANRLVQNRNSRHVRWITIDGETRNLRDWLLLKALHPVTYHRRVRDGMTPEEALTMPIHGKVSVPPYHGAYI